MDITMAQDFFLRNHQILLRNKALIIIPVLTRTKGLGSTMTTNPTSFQTLKSLTLISIAGVGHQSSLSTNEANAGSPMGVVCRPDGKLIVVDSVHTLGNDVVML